MKKLLMRLMSWRLWAPVLRTFLTTLFKTTCVTKPSGLTDRVHTFSYRTSSKVEGASHTKLSWISSLGDAGSPPVLHSRIRSPEEAANLYLRLRAFLAVIPEGYLSNDPRMERCKRVVLENTQAAPRIRNIFGPDTEKVQPYEPHYVCWLPNPPNKYWRRITLGEFLKVYDLSPEELA